MTTTAAPIGWFEIATTDPATTEAFYADVLGWSYNDDAAAPGYRIVDAGDGINGGITAAQAGLPPSYAIFSVQVADVAATCRQIEERGGKVLVGPETIEQNGLSFANVTDPEGNHFGLFSPPAG